MHLHSCPQAYGVSSATSAPVQVAYACGANCPASTTKNYTPLIVGLVVGLAGGLTLLAALAIVLVRRRVKRSHFSDVYLVPSALTVQDVDQNDEMSEAAERGAVKSADGKASSLDKAVAAGSAPPQAAEDPMTSDKAATSLDVRAPEEVVLVDGEVGRAKVALKKDEE